MNKIWIILEDLQKTKLTGCGIKQQHADRSNLDCDQTEHKHAADGDAEENEHVLLESKLAHIDMRIVLVLQYLLLFVYVENRPAQQVDRRAEKEPDRTDQHQPYSL